MDVSVVIKKYIKQMERDLIMKKYNKFLTGLSNGIVCISMFAAAASLIASWPFRIYLDEVPPSLLDDEE